MQSGGKGLTRDADGVDEAGKTLLHDVFNDVGDGDEHLRVDEAPDDLEERVDPLDGLCTASSDTSLTQKVIQTYQVSAG